MHPLSPLLFSLLSSLLSAQGFALSLSLSPHLSRATPRSASISLGKQIEAAVGVRWRATGDGDGVFNYKSVALTDSVTLDGLAPDQEYEVTFKDLSGGEPSAKLLVRTPPPEGNADGVLDELSKLEVRVGRVQSVEPHPEASGLYVCKVDVGESEERTVCAGLAKYIDLEELQGRSVLALCNLPPRTLRGIRSTAMLLCASNEGKKNVDPVAPPEDCAPGTLVTFSGVASAPAPPAGIVTRAWTRCTAEGFSTDNSGVAQARAGAAFEVDGKPCSSSISSGIIR